MWAGGVLFGCFAECEVVFGFSFGEEYRAVGQGAHGASFLLYLVAVVGGGVGEVHYEVALLGAKVWCLLLRLYSSFNPLFIWCVKEMNAHTIAEHHSLRLAVLFPYINLGGIAPGELLFGFIIGKCYRVVPLAGEFFPSLLS